MADGVSSIYFHSGKMNLDDAAQLLAKRGLSVARNGDRLSVSWADGPVLTVLLRSEWWVKVEAAEKCEGTKYADQMEECDTRFEIFFDDLDEVLDEINTLIEVQATLHDSTQGFLFNTWNGKLSGPSICQL